MFPLVVKRDGSKEKFNLINIANVVQAAGLTPEQAKILSQALAHWAENQQVYSLTSLQIRDQVLVELQRINPNAGELYKWYEQSKES